MNKLNWRDYPHLFANGNFKVLMNETKPTISRPELKWKIGRKYQLGGELLIRLQRIPELDCTLLARSIDDMTEKEIQEITEVSAIQRDLKTIHGDFYSMSDNDIVDLISEWGEEGDVPFSTACYLFSRGILPPNFSSEGVEFKEKETK